MYIVFLKTSTIPLRVVRLVDFPQSRINLY
jgi:hypothetical protein